MTGTGFKSWGHLLDGSSTKNTNGTTFASSAIADDVTNSSSAFDGDKQVYDLVGNVQEWIDYTVTRTSGNIKPDASYQGAGVTVPSITTAKFYTFADISQSIDFQGLGWPTGSGSMTTLADTNSGANDGLATVPSSDGSYGIVRGGAFDNASGSDSRSPLTIDLSTATTTTATNRGFRVICGFPTNE